MRDSLWLVIFASAGLPLLFLAVLTYAEYIVEEKPFWEVTVKIAWDMAVLGIGLTGGLFSDNAFLQHFTSRQAVLLTGTVIAVDFACVSRCYSSRSKRSSAEHMACSRWGLALHRSAFPVAC